MTPSFPTLRSSYLTTAEWPACSAARAISRPIPVEQPVISQRVISDGSFRQPPQVRSASSSQFGGALSLGHPTQGGHLLLELVKRDHSADRKSTRLNSSH